MTTHEGETIYFFDKKGNPVDNADKADVIEVVSADGTHTILHNEDSFKPGPGPQSRVAA